MDGNLVHTDLKGNQLQQMVSSDGFGYHTVTDDDDLIFTETDTKAVNTITPSKSISEFISTGEWGPISIVSSRINGDILVGMFMNKMPAKITRYNKTGKEIQTIQTDNTGRVLYEYPHYITENTNGDCPCCPPVNVLFSSSSPETLGQFLLNLVQNIIWGRPI